MREREFTKEFSVILIVDANNFILDENDIIDFHFREDIFSYSMVGRLTFIDKYGITEYGPLTGNERIILRYGRGYDSQLVFDMIKVGKISQSNTTESTRENGIVIDFADTSLEYFVRRRFSRSWKETEISDIVKHILREWVSDPKISQWEENKEEIDVCFPYFTPMESLMWLSKRGKGQKSKMPGFLYYNSTEDQFSGNWVSFDYLFGPNIYIDPNNYLFESDNQYYMNKILYWSISGLDKFSLKNIKGGHRFGYDFKTKKLLDREYSYKDTSKKITMLGKKSLYTDISDYRSMYVNEGENSEYNIDNIYYAGFIKRYNIQQALTIITRGSVERFAGMQVNIQWPSSDKRSGIFNKMWKGKWLVKSITHIFNVKSNIPYRQKMVLLKNAYHDADNRDLVKASKINK